MRVLHVILAPERNASALAVLQATSRAIDPVILAREGNPTAEAAVASGIPVIWLRPRQSIRLLHDAMEVLQPDLVHLHGALHTDHILPPSIWANRAGILQLDHGDFDANGELRRQVRGIRLDRGVGQKLLALVPHDMPQPRLHQLPMGVREIVSFRPGVVTPEWCQALYLQALGSPVRADVTEGLSSAA